MTPKLKFLLRFDQNVEYKCPAWAYPLHDFHEICRVCTPFQDALAVKILLDLLKGLRSYGGFNLTGSDYVSKRLDTYGKYFKTSSTFDIFENTLHVKNVTNFVFL